VKNIRYSTIEIRRKAIDALNRGMTIGAVAEAFGVDRTTLYRWHRRVVLEGTEGFERRSGSGRPLKFEGLDSQTIVDIITQPATNFGYETELWTIGRMRQIIRKKFKIVLSKNTIWRRVREAGLTFQKPERKYFEIDEVARKKWLKKEVPQIRATVAKYRAILYFQDESNISLTAFLGKTWSPKGQTPRAQVTGSRRGVAAMSAISPKGRLLFRLLKKRVASREIIQFLGQMMRHHPRRHLVVVMDQAPPHTSRITRMFINSQPRLHVFYLPKYSPDWNPDEKVWNHLKNHELASHQARTKDQLSVLARRRLRSMAANPQLIRGIFFRCCVADFFE
jgi:transposase